MDEIVCQVETYVWSSLRENFWTDDPDEISIEPQSNGFSKDRVKWCTENQG